MSSIDMIINVIHPVIAFTLCLVSLGWMYTMPKQKNVWSHIEDPTKRLDTLMSAHAERTKRIARINNYFMRAHFLNVGVMLGTMVYQAINNC